MTKFSSALLFASLVACSSISDSSFRFQGQVFELDEPPATPVALEVENIGRGALGITGVTTTPCWNDRVTLDGDKAGTTLRMVVDREPQDPCTDARTRHHLYLGAFSLLRRGTYTVRVIDSTGASDVVLVETTVQVR